MDGVCMGGGMGLGQGARWRVVTENSQLAMPETLIGLFPDVGGGYFLSRCPGHLGEYLALTGHTLKGATACEAGLADVCVPAEALPVLWEGLGHPEWQGCDAWVASCREMTTHTRPETPWDAGTVDRCFAAPTPLAIVAELEAVGTPWASATVAQLRQRSPLMLHVTLAQIRRGRHMTLAQDLRMERDLVHHCFHWRSGALSETVEGIRALVIDKDKTPHWNPERLEAVDPTLVDHFLTSPWPPHEHPLRHLS
jgi:enoyl-CoA hydratase